MNYDHILITLNEDENKEANQLKGSLSDVKEDLSFRESHVDYDKRGGNT